MNEGEAVAERELKRWGGHVFATKCPGLQVGRTIGHFQTHMTIYYKMPVCPCSRSTNIFLMD